MPQDSQRQAGATDDLAVKVTPEMIDAGVAAILPWLEEEWFSLHHRRAVRDAFLAMRKLESNSP